MGVANAPPVQKSQTIIVPFRPSPCEGTLGPLGGGVCIELWRLVAFFLVQPTPAALPITGGGNEGTGEGSYGGA